MKTYEIRTSRIIYDFYEVKANSQREAVASFRECWGNFLECNPSFRGDKIAKRTAFNDYVDGLNKDGLVTDYQAYNWSNPF